MAKLPDELEQRLERLARAEGLELLAIEVAGTARKAVVRLVLDKEEGGVSLGDCEQVSRQASVLFDAYDPFTGGYTLEVSSPGLDRKLYREKDFVRFAGQGVRVRMRPTWTGGRTFDGILEGRDESAVRIRDLDGEIHELPDEQVFEVRLAPQVEERVARREAKRARKTGSRGKKASRKAN